MSNTLTNNGKAQKQCNLYHSKIIQYIQQTINKYVKTLSNLRPSFVTLVRLQSFTAATAATHVLASGWSCPLFSILPVRDIYVTYL